MPIAKQLEVLAGNLQAYNSHLRSLSEALEALRFASDQILAAVDKDRELIAALTEQGFDGIEQIEGEAAGNAAVGAIVDEPSESVAAGGATLEIESGTAGSQDEPTAAAVIETLLDLSTPALAADIAPTAETLLALDSLAAKAASAAAIDTVAGPIDNIEAGTPVGAVEPIAAVAAQPIARDGACEPSAISTSIEASTVIATATGDAKVIDLSKRRKTAPRKAPAYRSAMAFAASLVILAGAVTGVHGLLQTEIGQRIIELGACDGDMLSAHRDCALLAWLHL